MSMLSLLFVPLFTASSAHAGDCDVKALTKELEDASPSTASDLFVKLAACDPPTARKLAPSVFPRVLSGDAGNAATLAAIKVGASDAAVAWIDELQSDERASAIGALGDECNKAPEVQQFFVDRSKAMGDDFWAQRWYRALATCHVQSVQEILWTELDRGLGTDRSKFFGILETFARSTGVNAIPRLKALAGRIEDPEAQVYIVSAFADAAQVGSIDGPNAEAVRAAIEAINEVAPKLQTKAVEQARLTLVALGDEQGADALVKVRYQDLLQKDGQLLWGTVVVENATCKNGKVSQRISIGQVRDPGQTWPDQLRDKVEASVKVAWELDLALRCKGTGDTKVLVPSTPFPNTAAFKTWAEERIREVKVDEVKKAVRLDRDEVQL